MTFRFFFSLLLFVSCLCSGLAFAAKSPPESALSKIDIALKKGELSKDEAALYRTFSIFDQKKLPQRFKGTGPVVPVKNGTMIIKQLKEDFETLSLQTQETLRPYLFKKKGKASGKVLYKTAGTGGDVLKKVVLDNQHFLANFTTTANFNIEWNVYSNFTSDVNGNSVPDIIDNWAEYLETSWTEIITNQGYDLPKGADVNLVDVYVGIGPGDSVPLGAGWYGYTDVYSDPPGVPFLVFNHEYSWAPPNSDSDKTAGAMKVTAAHEFFHTVHLTIDYWEDAWWMEASSTWMEDHVYNNVNDYYNYIGPASKWMLNPNVSLVLYNWSHEYGSVIWGKYLSENWGGASAIKSIWDRAMVTPGPGSVNATSSFFSSQSTTLPEAFKEFAVKNVFMDYSEGENYGSVAIRATYSAYTSAIQNSQNLSLAVKSPDYLGANYLRFNPAGGTNLTIVFDGDEYYRGWTIKWGASIVIPTLTGYTSYEIPLDSNAQNGFTIISGYNNYSAVYLAASVLSETGLTPSESSLMPYIEYPDGIPYSFQVCEDCSASSLPLIEFLDNDESITIGKVGSGGGGGGGCFIATAAYGYYDEPHVMLLRDFRDSFLLTNSPGRSFVDFYYRVSPEIADYIAEREWLKSLVRILLMPLIVFAWLVLNVSFPFLFFAFILFSAVLLRLYTFKKHSNKLIS